MTALEIIATAILGGGTAIGGAIRFGMNRVATALDRNTNAMLSAAKADTENTFENRVLREEVRAALTHLNKPTPATPTTMASPAGPLELALAGQNR